MSDPEADPFGDVTTSRVVLVAGKGGVGKTTVTAVLARNAARLGRRVLVVELDGKPTVDELVTGTANTDASDHGGDASAGGSVNHLSASQALEQYLLEHGFRRIAKRLVSTGVIEVVGTAAPGIDDLVVLGRIKQLERSGEWDLIVVDGPAAGHAITMLTSAAGLRNAVSGGPVGAQADEVMAMLANPARSSVVLVALPETTPVNELFEAAEQLRERVGVRLAAVVVNNVDVAPALTDPATVDFGRSTAQVDDAIAAAEFRRQRQAVQQAEVDRVVAHFEAVDPDLPVIVVPSVPVAQLTAHDVDTLADTAQRLVGERR